MTAETCPGFDASSGLLDALFASRRMDWQK